MSDVAPTGRRIEWLATVWVDVHCDKITNWSAAYDSIAILSQLGKW